MDIGIFIGDLLREQNEVNVPGLGTFFNLRIPASFDPGSNTYLPPSYQIAFKKSTDNLHALAEYISKQKKLSINSSDYFVRKFASNIFDQLQETGTAEIKPLGLMHKKDDELAFENTGSYDLSDQYFGLKAVKTIRDTEKTHAENVNIAVETEQPVVEKSAERYVSSPIEDFITGVGGSEDKDVEDPFGSNEIDESELEYTSPGRFSPLLAASLIMAVLVLGGFLLYRFNPSVQQWVDNYRSSSSAQAPETVSPEVQMPLIDTLDIADSSITSPDTVSNNLNTLTDTAKAVIAEPAANEPETVYEIIVASFARKADAESYIKQLGLKGIKARIADNLPGTISKVSVASIADKATAEKEFARIRKELNPEAWMVQAKKKNP